MGRAACNATSHNGVKNDEKDYNCNYGCELQRE